MFSVRKMFVSAFIIASGLVFTGLDASAACGPEATGFCTGEIAMNRNYEVKILDLYANGTARLLFLVDNSEGVFSVSDLVKIRSSLDGWHRGQSGMNRNYEVVVEQIYGNHTAKLRFLVDGSEGVFSLSDVTHHTYTHDAS